MLYKKGEESKYAYVVLLGIVNLYNTEESHISSSSDSDNIFLTATNLQKFLADLSNSGSKRRRQ